MDFFLEISYGIYLGFAVTAFGRINASNWRFYAIIIPTIILANLGR